MTLKKCPCGRYPNKLAIEAGSSCKWAFVYGDCCGSWLVEFKANCKDLDSEEIYDLAVDVWNDNPRSKKLEKVLGNS